MQLTNTRPLLDSSLSPSQSTSTLRRNASGILAGEQMFRADIRESAPQAIMQDYNRRVQGDPKEYQVDYQGEFSRYNDGYRDRMFDSLDTLKQQYSKYGGRDPSFTNQIRDMENYMYFNRAPMTNPLQGSVPYQQSGPATIFANQQALPPAVYPYPAPYMGGPFIAPPLIDHDRRMMRTHLASQKQTINELQEELHSVKREGQRFEDILHKSHHDIHRLSANHFPGVHIHSGIDAMDPRKSMVKWGDAETDKTLNGLGLKEQELIRTLSKLPENSDMYKQKRAKLDELVRQRNEVEKMLHSKADYKNYLHEKVVDDSKKDNIAQWLRRDLELFKIDKTDEDFIDRKYRPGMGFLIYWDYILNLVKEFKRIQIVYGIYNKGLTLFEPRLVQLTDTIDTTHPSFCQAIFAINHLVRDVEAHPDILLILEIQVPATKMTTQAKKSNITEAVPHTGYLLGKYGKMTANGVYGDMDETETDEYGIGYDPKVDTNVFQTYGWSVLDLFNFKNDLKRGTYKLPLYKPPTIINLDTRDIPQLERIKDTMLWMRVCHPKDDEINEVRCEPAYYHIYYVPEIHNIAPKVQMYLKPDRDPNYKCEGFTLFMHWVKGYQHQRHIRVAAALQMSKDIVLQENGHLCFYTTRGIQYPKPKSGNILKAVGSQGKETRANTFTGTSQTNVQQMVVQSTNGKELTPAQLAAHYYHADPEKTVYFNEQRTWVKDIYNMLWDIELKENVYLVLQFIERKPEVEIPTVNATITRKLIEDEYDLVGYTVLQINNPDGTIRYGSYILDFYDGPIFVEELDALKRNEKSCKITISKPGDFVPFQGPPVSATPNKAKSAKSVADNNSKVGTPNTPKTPGSQRKSPMDRPVKSRAASRASKSRDRDAQEEQEEERQPRRKPSSRRMDEILQQPKRKESSRNKEPLSRSKSRGRDDEPRTPSRSLNKTPTSRRGEPKSPNNRSFKGQTPKSRGQEERKRPMSMKGKKKKGKPSSRRTNDSYDEYGDEDPFDSIQRMNNKIMPRDASQRRRDQFFIDNPVPQNAQSPFPQGSGIDFYVDAARFLPDNVTVTKIQITAYTTEHQQISVSAGGLPDLDSSTTFNHYYGFRYEFRLPRCPPTMVVIITMYTIDRTSNQIRTVGWSVFPMFLNRISQLPSDNIKDRDVLLNEGNYQVPIYIQNPRILPEIRADALDLLERLPCASLLIRVNQAPTGSGNTVLSAKTVPQNQWSQLGVVVPAPDYQSGLYNSSYCKVTDAEFEIFQSRSDRAEMPLKDTAEQLMLALAAQRSKNSDTLLDWIDQKISIENDDPPLLDLKYFAIYDADFGFKVAIDGIHNVPRKSNAFYCVIVSLNPPASLYTDSKIPTSDVNLVSTFDWDSSVLSCRFLDNYFFYQGVQPNPQQTLIFDVRTIEFVQGIPKVETVAWSSIPIFFLRYGNSYVRSGVFQVPLFKGQVDLTHLENMKQFDDPWSYIAQKLNDRSIILWEGVSLVMRLLDSQRDGHYLRPFDYDRFNMVYIPENMVHKLNYAYTGATESRLKATPRLSSLVPPTMDKVIFQEAVNRTFNNMFGFSTFK